jgi:hypothetical protein
MDIQTYAKKELDLALKSAPDSILLPFIPQILSLCDTITKASQNPNLVPAIANRIAFVIDSLCSQRPITPLTGDESEWDLVSDGLYQNNRYPTIYKDQGMVYNTQAIMWRMPDGTIREGITKDGISSKQYVKAFPFWPRTFYVDAIENTNPDGTTELIIRDRNQLTEISDFYAINI